MAPLVDLLFNNGVWAANIALIILLVARMCRLGLVVHYPCFFTYLSLVAVTNLCGWTVYYRWTTDYQWFQPIAAFLTGLFGFFVVFEVYRQIFQPFPSVRLIVNWSILVLVLLILGTYLGLTLTGTIRQGSGQLFFQLERWLRFTQAGLLAFLVASAHQYRLPLGRNVFGLAMGFGLYVSFQVVNFTLQALAIVDLTLHSHLVANTFLLTIVIWLNAFRAYAPNPFLERSPHLKDDYARLGSAVTATLLGLRGALRRVAGM